MAIYQLFEEKKEEFTETFSHIHTDGEGSRRSRIFSTLVTRFCFLFLLVADLAWFAYNTLMLTLATLCLLVTGGRNPLFKRRVRKCALHFRRSALCGLALFIGLFSPPFGIMVACTYFLMYDKAGMEEVVPAPLQAQFKDIFHTDL